MDKIKNFLEREEISKEYELLNQIIELAEYRGIMEAHVLKVLIDYQQAFFNMLCEFDSENFRKRN